MGFTNQRRHQVPNDGEGETTVAKILIIEDDGVLRFDIAQTILGWHHDVKTATNAIAGIRIIKEWRPQLVLSDIYMPHISGYELRREVSKMNIDKSEMAFFFVTQLHRSQIAIKETCEMADDYISKPINYEGLRDKIEATLKRMRTGSFPLNSPRLCALQGI